MDNSINFNTYVEPGLIGDATPEFCYSTKEELHKKLMEAHEDVLAGRVKPIEQDFAELSKKYNL